MIRVLRYPDSEIDCKISYINIIKYIIVIIVNIRCANIFVNELTMVNKLEY